ncbi:GD22148 [Drosophila simulans]|uniref:GD22148 n=1 Tax=Drosophila simulans TaxID=7240 RepID=B4Q3B4_DROSI|nr:GD22148 [Drosophila simulans]
MSLACKRAVKFLALHNNIIKGWSATSVPRSPFSGTALLKYRITAIQSPPAEVCHKTNAMDSVTIWSRLVNQLGSSRGLELEMAKDDRRAFPVWVGKLSLDGVLSQLADEWSLLAPPGTAELSNSTGWPAI